jgi:hypothetical protein
MKVTQQEVIDDYTTAKLALLGHSDVYHRLQKTLGRIKQHGIEVPYTPFTWAEWDKLDLEKNDDNLDAFEWEKIVEQTVLARLGVAPTLDQAKQICEQAGYAVVPWVGTELHEAMLEAAKDKP